MVKSNYKLINKKMPEAVAICLDNSEFNRNGDFAPSRFVCQQDAAAYLADAKLAQNPQNTIGIIQIAGNRIDVKMSQTNDIGLINQSIQNCNINGDALFVTGVKVA